MNKKALVVAAVTVVASGVGIAFAIKKSKSKGNCKLSCCGQKLNDKIKEKLIKTVNVNEKLEELGEIEPEISIKPMGVVTNIFIIKKDGSSSDCFSNSK